MFFPVLIPYGAGLMNGYTKKEGGLPRTTTYTILSLSSAVGFLRGVQSVKLPFYTGPSQALATLALMVPLVVGTSFCSGLHFGKALRHTEEVRHTVME
jgi:hypothetical protein